MEGPPEVSETFSNFRFTILPKSASCCYPFSLVLLLLGDGRVSSYEIIFEIICYKILQMCLCAVTTLTETIVTD